MSARAVGLRGRSIAPSSPCVRGSGPIAAISSSLIPEVMKRRSRPRRRGPRARRTGVDELARAVRRAAAAPARPSLGRDRQHHVAHRAQAALCCSIARSRIRRGSGGARARRSSSTVRSQRVPRRMSAARRRARRVVVEGGPGWSAMSSWSKGFCVSRGVPRGLRQGPGAKAATTGTPHAIASMHVQPEALVPGREHEGARRPRRGPGRCSSGTWPRARDGGVAASVVAELRAIARRRRRDRCRPPAQPACESSPGHRRSCAPCGSPP